MLRSTSLLSGRELSIKEEDLKCEVCNLDIKNQNFLQACGSKY